MTMLPKSKILAISLLAAVAVAGFAAGAATMSRAEPGRRNRDYSYSAQLADQLGLSQVQQDSIPRHHALASLRDAGHHGAGEGPAGLGADAGT
ncbi:MAG: hypothetical protein ACHQX4_11050 [Gemmatimonadales bacterium]